MQKILFLKKNLELTSENRSNKETKKIKFTSCYDPCFQGGDSNPGPNCQRDNTQLVSYLGWNMEKAPRAVTADFQWKESMALIIYLYFCNMKKSCTEI